MFKFITIAVLALTSSVSAVYEHTHIAALAKMSDMVVDKLQTEKAASSNSDLADYIIKFLDADKDSEVSLDELMAFYEKLCKKWNYTLTDDDKEAVEAEFDKVDTDGSGDVDKTELVEAIKNDPRIASIGE